MDYNISDAELELMKVLWQSGAPMTAQQVSEQLQGKDWKYSTIATLFSAAPRTRYCWWAV